MQRQRPLVEDDMENGQYLGGDGSNPNDTTSNSSFVTAMVKNNGQTAFALKGGNSQSGGLTTFWNGPLPNGYAPMHLEGGIVLGTGGGGDNNGVGSFFEGVITAGYPSDAADNAAQANITSVGYAGATGTAASLNPPPRNGAGNQPRTFIKCRTVYGAQPDGSLLATALDRRFVTRHVSGLFHFGQNCPRVVGAE